MRRRSTLTTYAALAIADAALAAGGNKRTRRLTKPALMPMLAAAAVAGQEKPDETRNLVLAGLGMSWAGDVALLGEGEGPFAAGLVSFLTAHFCYLAALAKKRRGGIRKWPALAATYVVAWCVLNALLWPKTGKLRAPVVVYGSALAAMALAALDTGDAKVAAGGALFMVSDSILALRTFEAADIPNGDGLVMLTYTAAQALLADGMLS